MVLDNSVVVSIMKAMVTFVACYKEVKGVARRLDLVDGHFLYVDCPGVERKGNQQCEYKSSYY